MALTLTPSPYQTVLDSDGDPVSGAKVNTYLAGTTTRASTYTTSVGDVANANPIVADSAGRFVAYLSAGLSYKFVITTSADVAVDEQDNVLAVPGSSVNLDVTATAGVAIAAGEVAYIAKVGDASGTPGLWYLTDADSAEASSEATEIGIAVSAIAINTSGTIRLAGEVDTAGAVVKGTVYYCSATAGELTSSAPTNTRTVGIAQSTSTLLLNANTAVTGIPSPITQDLLFTDDTYDIGKSGATRPRDLFQSRNATIGGTLAVTGVATLTAQPILSALTASQAAFTDGSKGLVSNAITGTGNVVMSASPTLTGTIGAAALTLSTPLVVGSGGSGVASHTAYGVIVGGTGTTAATQTITPGVSGTIFTSGGTSGVPTWAAASAGGFSPLNIVEGRLTLTSATPVTTADATGATTLYWALYKGNRIALYTGSEWSMETVAELSISVPATTDTMYDAFVDYNGGTPALAVTAWSSDTARATALTTQDGVLVQTGNLDWRYVGSFRTTGSSGQTEDSFAKRWCWNYANRVTRAMQIIETTNSWTYTLDVWRQANASTANQIDYVVGVAEVAVHVYVAGAASSDAADRRLTVGVGHDSTNTLTSGTIYSMNYLSTNNKFHPMHAELWVYPAIGRHYDAWLERSQAAGTSTWVGDDGAPDTTVQSGIAGEIQG